MKKKYRKMIKDAEEKQFCSAVAWVGHQYVTWRKVRRLIESDKKRKEININ